MWSTPTINSCFIQGQILSKLQSDLATVKDLNYTSSCKVMIWTIVWSRDWNAKNSTWKYKIMVHTKPSTIEGLPSAISVEFMLTSLICIEKKPCYYHTQRTATLKCISKRVCIWNAFLQSDKILNLKNANIE